MEMMSNFDVTNSAHQIQMTTMRPWTNPPPWKFLRTPLSGDLNKWLSTRRDTYRMEQHNFEHTTKKPTVYR